MNIQEKFAKTREELSASLIEREPEIDLVLTALIAQEHVLLVGPPGTGKSLLADSIVGWMHGEKFSILMTKFTTPEEVCGPISISALKRDEYLRVVKGKLPEAHVAYLDEIFKSSSAILNTVLTILNERTYRNNGTLLRCPLKLCVASSNEWPGDQEGGKELGALFDRFLLRKAVKPIATDKGLSTLLWGGSHIPSLSTTITPAEIEQANKEAEAIVWTDDAQKSLVAIVVEAKREGICPGDRRLYKAVGAVKAYAYLQGSSQVESDHLDILSHILWEDPTEQPKKLAEIVGRIANPTIFKINGLLVEAQQIIASTNPKELSQAASATKKLSEIHKSLKAIKDKRADSALSHVEGEIKRIKLATVEAM